MPNPPKRPPTPLPIVKIPQSKPVANVPELVIEDPTPVDMPLDAVLERRSRQTKESVETTLTSVNAMRGELRQYVVTDQAEHKLLFAGMRTLADKQKETAADVKELHGTVGELKTETANMSGKLDILIGLQQSNQRVVEHREKVTIEREATETKIKLEDAADERKFKRQKWLKIIGIIATLATALAGALAAATGKC